jgi:formylglycine-generating enzyme required for sulfatase activity
MPKPLALALLILAAAPWCPAAAVTRPSTQPADQLALTLAKNVSMNLVLIPAGKFMMGSAADEKDRSNLEDPPHQVTISRPFYMAVTPITQAQWKAVTGKSPAAGPFVQLHDDNAMASISWVDATDFCRKLSVKTGRTVRLPTEAQWEYACRAGTQTRFYFGDDPDSADLPDHAWYDKNTSKLGQQYPHPVAQKKPNPWGLYDMHGNVNQWCADWLGPYPAATSLTDPTGPATGSFRVFRGGSFMTNPTLCRDAARNRNSPARRIIDNGLRVIVLPRPGNMPPNN